VEAGYDALPLKVEVEPVVEFLADDEASVNAAVDAAHPCKVTILKCTHRARDFHSGAGTIGEACIRVRLSPLDDSNDKQLSVWGTDKQVRSLRIREARAVQVNAYPPKPKTNVDLYTSYVYGDSSVDVTLVLQTSITKSGETPDLHVELFLALPQKI
jgi:hypothetical protein